MEYTIKKLATMSGVSTRTLRYYDEIGLLKPARISSSGYRIYGREQVDQLQQILIYRELWLSLEKIKDIIGAPDFDHIEALREHHLQLTEKKKQLDRLITNVENSIAMKEGRIKMSDHEKFEGLKQRMIDENEKKYGKEVRDRYGDDAVDRSNDRLKNMSEKEFMEIGEIENQLNEKLLTAMKTGDPAGKEAQEAADLHRQWLCFYWDNYSKEAHTAIAQMYVEDERFTAYYDKIQQGAAKFLHDAIIIYAK